MHARAISYRSLASKASIFLLASMRQMLVDCMGYRAILTFRAEHGVDVSARTVQNYVLRLRRGDAPATRAIRGVVTPLVVSVCLHR